MLDWKSIKERAQKISADVSAIADEISASAKDFVADAKVKATAVTLLNNDYEFKATGSIIIFDGYLKVYGNYESSEDVVLDKL